MTRIALVATLAFGAAILAGAALIVRGAPHDCTRDPEDDGRIAEMETRTAALVREGWEATRRADPFGHGRAELERRNGRR